MAKFKPGIPTAFTLDVKPVQDLGDYLDEPGPAPAPPKPPREAPPGPPLERAVTLATPRVAVADPPPAAPPAPQVRAAPVTVAPASGLRAGPPVGEEVRPQAGAARAKAPRREVSMTPDTLRMSDELVDLIRGGSGQRDTKANELFHALVLLVYEARGELDTHTIPKRGQWGTPTARAYPRELANAFLRAILRKYAGLSDSPTGLRYPVNSAA